MQQLFQYSYLQLLDLLSTIAFLSIGVEEGNPIVSWAIRSSPNPLTGLLLVKLCAMAIGIYCWYGGRSRLLTRANIIFAIIVTWNLMSLIAKSATAA